MSEYHTEFIITIKDGRKIKVSMKGEEDHCAFRGILGSSKYVVKYDEVGMVQ